MTTPSPRLSQSPKTANGKELRVGDAVHGPYIASGRFGDDPVGLTNHFAFVVDIDPEAGTARIAYVTSREDYSPGVGHVSGPLNANEVKHIQGLGGKNGSWSTELSEMPIEMLEHRNNLGTSGSTWAAVQRGMASVYKDNERAPSVTGLNRDGTVYQQDYQKSDAPHIVGNWRGTEIVKERLEQRFPGSQVQDVEMKFQGPAIPTPGKFQETLDRMQTENEAWSKSHGGKTALPEPVVHKVSDTSERKDATKKPEVTIVEGDVMPSGRKQLKAVKKEVEATNPPGASGGNGAGSGKGNNTQRTQVSELGRNGHTGQPAAGAPNHGKAGSISILKPGPDLAELAVHGAVLVGGVAIASANRASNNALAENQTLQGVGAALTAIDKAAQAHPVLRLAKTFDTAIDELAAGAEKLYKDATGWRTPTEVIGDTLKAAGERVMESPAGPALRGIQQEGSDTQNRWRDWIEEKKDPVPGRDPRFSAAEDAVPRAQQLASALATALDADVVLSPTQARSLNDAVKNAPDGVVAMSPQGVIQVFAESERAGVPEGSAIVAVAEARAYLQETQKETQRTNEAVVATAQREVDTGIEMS